MQSSNFAYKVEQTLNDDDDENDRDDDNDFEAINFTSFTILKLYICFCCRAKVHVSKINSKSESIHTESAFYKHLMSSHGGKSEHKNFSDYFEIQITEGVQETFHDAGRGRDIYVQPQGRTHIYPFYIKFQFSLLLSLMQGNTSTGQCAFKSDQPLPPPLSEFAWHQVTYQANYISSSIPRLGKGSKKKSIFF